MTPTEFQAFKHERDTALLALDERRLRAYISKYKVKMPTDPKVFWLGIHKAREALLSLPEWARQESRDWLHAHGSWTMDENLDRGDVP